MPKVIGLVVLGLLIQGCAKHKPEDALLGTWIGDPPVVTELKKDPQLAQYSDMFKDAYSMELKEDHTYKIHCWALKSGKWKQGGRFVHFEETSSNSEVPEGLAGILDFTDDSKPGSHQYKGVISSDDKRITLVMGRIGDIVFHR